MSWQLRHWHGMIPINAILTTERLTFSVTWRQSAKSGGKENVHSKLECDIIKYELAYFHEIAML